MGLLCFRRERKKMGLQIVVVSQSVHRANQIERLLSGWRVNTVWASNLEECRVRLSVDRKGLLIYDQVNSQIPRQEVLDAANRAEAPMIAILEQFDSKRWVEILKEGASDVLADPLSAEQLQRSISTMSPGDSLEQRRIGWERLKPFWQACRRVLHL